MKRIIKYILVILLVFIAYLATNERFIYQLVSFEQTYGEITFEYSIYGDKDNKKLVKKDIFKDLKDKQFDIYKVETKYITDYSIKKTIYGTEGAINHLKSLGIKSGKYSSIFAGDIEVVFFPIEQLNNIYSTDTFRFIGSYEKAAKFKNIYSYKNNKYFQVADIKDISGSENDVYATLYLIWGITFFLILLISLYEVILSKKEIMIKLTLGINPQKTFIEYSLSDTIVYVLIFFGLSILLGLFFNVRYKFGTVSILFLLMLLINTLINYTITKVSIKKDMSNHLGNRAALVATYFIKTLCLILSIIIFSANGIILIEGISFFKQEKFFRNKDVYNYYRFFYSVSTSDKEKLSESQDHERIDLLWNDFDKSFGKNALCNFDLSETFDTNTILINENSIKHFNYNLSQELSLKLLSANKDKIYVFAPEKTKISKERISSAIQALFLNGESDKEIIFDSYKGDASLVAINKTTNNYRSRLLNKPIIILDTIKSSYTERYLNPKYFGENILYRISDEEFHSFTDKHSISNEIVTVTNTKKLYLHNRSDFLRSIKLITVISLFICILEFTMIIFFVNLEYINHGLELTIKKTLGYSILSRNIRTIIIPLVIIPFCSILSYIIIYITNFGNAALSVFIGITLLIIELVITLFRCSSIEQKNISNILKGDL